MYNDKLSLAILKNVFSFLEEKCGTIQYSRILDVEGGYAFKSGQYTKTGNFVLRVTNISADGSISHKSSNKFISDKKLIEELSNYVLREDDVLIVMVGGSLGKVGIVSQEVLPALLNQNLWRVKNRYGFSPRYIYYLSLFLNEFKAIVKTSTHGHFSRKKYRDLLVPNVRSEDSFVLADYLDQLLLGKEIPKNEFFQAISGQLETLLKKEQLITEINFELLHQLNTVRQLRQTFLSEAIQGELIPQNYEDESADILLERIRNLVETSSPKRRPKKKKVKKQKIYPILTGREIPFRIPSNWTWCRFIDIASIESNLVSPFDHPTLPHIAPDNIEKNTGRVFSYKTVAEDEVRSGNHYFYPGHLIYSKVRPKLNKVALVDFEGLCSADMYPIWPLINTKFLQYGMLSSYFLAEVDKFDNRVKMPKINQNQLSQIPFPLPPLAEQKRIVKKLDELMSICDGLAENIKESKAQAESLLQVALKEALEPNYPETDFSSAQTN